MSAVFTVGKWANLCLWLYVFGAAWAQIIAHWNDYQESPMERAAVVTAFALGTATILTISIGMCLK